MKHYYGSFLPANISTKSSVEVIGTIQQSSIHYLDELEKEISKIPIYQSPSTKEITKRITAYRPKSSGFRW